MKDVIVVCVLLGGIARGRTGARVRVARSRSSSMRGRRCTLSHSRVLDLSVPSRKTFPIRFCEVRPQVTFGNPNEIFITATGRAPVQVALCKDDSIMF